MGKSGRWLPEGDATALASRGFITAINVFLARLQHVPPPMPCSLSSLSERS